MRYIPLLVSALLAGGGCSWIALDAPPRTVRAGDAVRCSDSYVAPAVDALSAIALGIGGVFLLCERDNGERLTYGCAEQQLGGLVAIIAGFVYSVSALSGSSQVSDCRDAKRHADGT